VCIFSYWIYVAPICIVHLPLTTVGVCVDPVGVGQVIVAGNVHTRFGNSLSRVLPGILRHSLTKASTYWGVVSARIDAVHVSSVGVAVCIRTKAFVRLQRQQRCHFEILALFCANQKISHNNEVLLLLAIEATIKIR